MPWLKIDDRVRTHPKIVAAGPDAAWFWFCGICYCREHLTDGFIPKGMLASLCPGVGMTVARRLVHALVAKKLWHETEGGYQVHDFLDWNPSRADVLSRRADDRARKKDGIQENSDRNSDRKETGIREDSSRAGAAARGLGSGLGSGSSEESPRGTVPGPRRFDRAHAEHVFGFCDFKCLSEAKVNEFAKDLPRGLSDPDNFGRVIAWATQVRDNWGDRPKVEPKWWEFWEARWRERSAATTTPGEDRVARELAESDARRRSVQRS